SYLFDQPPSGNRHAEIAKPTPGSKGLLQLHF
ncbi:hypothetical protein ACVI1T_005117, partial [Rhizobium redzepovicii]